MGEQLRVAEVMTRRVVVLSEEDNLSQVATSLERLHFHHLPVVDDGKLVGMLSQRDLLKYTVTSVDRSPFAASREARMLEQTFVRDVMRTPVLTIRSDDLISTAAARMLKERIGALPVVDEQGMLQGIITENDILRVVAQEGQVARTLSVQPSL